VLVVEDDPLLGWALRETFVASGHAVVEARDGANGLRAAETAPEPFDVILLDHQLAEREPWLSLGSFRRLSPTSAGVLLAEPEGVTQPEGRIGEWHVLNKPFDMQALDQVVREAAAESRYEQQNRTARLSYRLRLAGDHGNRRDWWDEGPDEDRKDLNG
jgi:DNA-binding response OmpR family regulator